MTDTQRYEEVLKPFTDAQNVSHWAVEYMAKAVNLGIVKGGQQKQYKFTKLYYARRVLCNVNKGFKPGCNYRIIHHYTRMYQLISWYCAYIKKAYELKIIKGAGDNLFYPDKPISRQDMAVMVSNAFGLKSNDNYSRFSDNDKISSYAYDAVYTVYSNKIMQGDGGNFNPTSQTTREMAVTVLVRYLNSLKINIWVGVFRKVGVYVKKLNQAFHSSFFNKCISSLSVFV